MQSDRDDQVVVRAQGLGRRYGRVWALAHVDLELERGEAVMLAGSNGSGKTTLLRLVAGLERPTAGTVSVLGADPRREAVSSRRALTLVSHHSFLYERLTALEMVQLWSSLAGVESTSRAQLLALLEEVELGRVADQQVGGFSAGMRKRLTLLRTRIERPRLLLWDEPFAALDAAGRRLLGNWVQELRQSGVTMILATHDVAFGAALCPRALVLGGGQLRWVGPSSEVNVGLEAYR